jgi:octaprenyl-diphosphate synthase
MDQFLGLIQEEMELFEQRLDKALQSDVQLVHEVSRYMSTVKGKRLRPALAFMCAKAVGAWDKRIIDAAVVVEMIHAATMIHDDVIDSAATRRGKASVNSVWSNQIAVLMGDFLLSRALCILVDLGDLLALQTVSRATERLSQGEIFEIQIGQQTDTREDSYFGMVSDKTASLVVASCKIGPILVGAPAQVIKSMGEYGESLGKAFQIADDILDFTGNAHTMGKPVGHDLHEDKITLPLIYALKAAPDHKRTNMETLLQQEDKGDAEYQQIIEFVEQYEGVNAASKVAREYGTRAQECLEVLDPSPARTALELAVRLVVERNN